MTGYIQLYSSAEVNEQELSQWATDFLAQGGIVKQSGVLGFAGAELSPLDGRKYNITTGGTAFVPNSGYAANGSNPKYWLVRFSGATETLTFTSNSSGSTRIDLICIKVDTTVTDAAADNTGVVSIVVVAGTPGAGVPATPDNHLALYEVTVANGETEIDDANVADVRSEAYIDVQSFITSGLANNLSYAQKDSTGVIRSLLKLNASDVLEIGETNIATINAVGNLLLNNAKALQGKETGGTARGLAQVDANNVGVFGDTSLVENAVKTMAKARAYLSAEQSNLTNDTFTKVALNAESYDVGGDFDTGNNRFVAPVTGYYLVSGRVSFNNVVSDRIYYAAIYKNGSNYSQQVAGFPVTYSTPGISFAEVIQLNAGQYVELWALASSGVNTVDVAGGSTQTFMDVHLLSI